MVASGQIAMAMEYRKNPWPDFEFPESGRGEFWAYYGDQNSALGKPAKWKKISNKIASEALHSEYWDPSYRLYGSGGAGWLRTKTKDLGPVREIFWIPRSKMAEFKALNRRKLFAWGMNAIDLAPVWTSELGALVGGSRTSPDAESILIQFDRERERRWRDDELPTALGTGSLWPDRLLTRAYRGKMWSGTPEEWDKRWKSKEPGSEGGWWLVRMRDGTDKVFSRFLQDNIELNDYIDGKAPDQHRLVEAVYWVPAGESEWMGDAAMTRVGRVLPVWSRAEGTTLAGGISNPHLANMRTKPRPVVTRSTWTQAAGARRARARGWT
jgi:hypothetical protein